MPEAALAQDTVILEGIVDRHGLQAVLSLLSDIASEKAEHLRANWQDEPAARRWDAAMAAISRTLNNRAIRDLPGPPKPR